MKDKDVVDIIFSIKNHVSKWYATSPNIERSLSVTDLSTILSESVEEEVVATTSIRNAVDTALIESEDELILIFGSFYTISEAFEIIKELES